DSAAASAMAPTTSARPRFKPFPFIMAILCVVKLQLSNDLDPEVCYAVNREKYHAFMGFC
ncbi:hypothetical protein N8194_03805, partial [Akkermansiaceae bacterium]|nr:hypothetical protein [Akkermansiaceae bacterium]